MVANAATVIGTRGSDRPWRPREASAERPFVDARVSVCQARRSRMAAPGHGSPPLRVAIAEVFERAPPELRALVEISTGGRERPARFCLLLCGDLD